MNHSFPRIASILITAAASAAGLSHAIAAPFTDYLVQPPKLTAPERGSVAGSLAQLAFEPGSMSRGGFSLPIPIALPAERGAALANVLPTYSPDGGQTEWGVGWRTDLSIQRTAIVGDIDLSGDEFVSPWGRLVPGTDERYRPAGRPAQISLRRIDDGWEGVSGDGTIYRFAAADRVAGGYAWMLSRVDSVLGEHTVITYERNATGRPFVTVVEWGGRGEQRQYRAELGYETIAVPLDDYRSGTRLSLDRRVREVRVLVRSGTSGLFEVGWTYQLDYTARPGGAGFYLAGVTRTHRSGAHEPTQRYDYDFGAATIAGAALVDVPALDTVLATNGNGALLPDKALAFDLEEDGELDFEIAKDLTLVRQRGGVFTTEPLPVNPASNPLCRPPVSSANLPRMLARMTADATEPQVLRTALNSLTGKTRILLCDRQGVPVFDQQFAGPWALGPSTHLVDLNHDHRPDLIRVFSRGYQVIENTSGPGGYSFVAHPSGVLAESFTPDSSWLQDMNGDGQADIVMRSSTAVTVWYGLGNFEFTQTGRVVQLKTVSGAPLLDVAQRQLTFVDVNRDGVMDVLTTRGRSVNLFINNGRELNEVSVPALAGLGWDFGIPVVADITGNGDFALMLVQNLRAKALSLTTAATGLLVAARDGKGTDVSFGYTRGPAAPRIGRRTVVVDTVRVASSGYDPVSYSYRYGEPILHTAGKHLVGFASVDKQSPLTTSHVEFLNDDDVAGVPRLSEDSDDRSPGILRFTHRTYDDVTAHDVRWLRPAFVETGYRSTSGTVQLATTTAYVTYERDVCPTVITTASPSGQLMTFDTLASVAGLPDDLHCLPASRSLLGSHTDSTHDFHYMVGLDRNALGQVTRVTQYSPTMALLVLQDVTYDADHRIASVTVPGHGTTIARYDGIGRLGEVTDPTGVTMQVAEFDPISDAPIDFQTRRPGASLTTSFAYDDRERVRAVWNDMSGSTPARPLNAYSYRDATSATPGRVDIQTLADASTGISRRSAALFAADGASMVTGTWLGDRFALGDTAIRSRNTLARRTAFAGTMTDTELSALTSDELRALGTPLSETLEAGFGHEAQVTTTYQANVVGAVTTDLALGATELVKRDHHPGGFTTEVASDTIGDVVRRTDENGIAHRYTHDALGRLVRVDTPDGAQTVVFDGFGRPAQVIREGVGAIRYAYDPTSGLLTRKQRLDRYGAVVDTSDTRHDAIGRTIAVKQMLPSGEESNMVIDYDGRLAGGVVPGQLGRMSRLRGDGWERSELFDALGRLSEQHTTLTGWRDLTRSTTYRADSSVASDSLTIADAGGAVRFASTKETTVDSAGRVRELRVDGAVLYTLLYDGEGRLNRAHFSSGEELVFDYDPVTHRRRGHRIEAPDVSGGVHWERDARGLITSETYDHDADSVRRDYTFDGRGALIVAATPTETTRYAYTASGLPASTSDASGTRALRSTSGQITAVDADHTWDSAGRVAGKGEWTFDYGPDDQLRRARKLGRQIDFTYDEANQRLLKRIDGVPVRAEVAGGVLTEDHFVEVITIGGVVAGVLDNGQFIAFLADPRGTPFAGPDGTPALASPYGVRAGQIDFGDVIDYARLGRDADLDLVRMGIRDYDARLAQFLTPDPLYFENLDKCKGSPLQCSLYGYTAGNPVNFVDPTGMDGVPTMREVSKFPESFKDTAEVLSHESVFGRLPVDGEGKPQVGYANLKLSYEGDDVVGYYASAGLFNAPVGPGISATAVTSELGIGRFKDSAGNPTQGVMARGSLVSITVDPHDVCWGNWCTGVGVDFGVGVYDVSATINASTAAASIQGNVITGAVTVGTPQHSIRAGASFGEGAALRVHFGDADGNGKREMGFGADIEFVQFDVKSELISDVLRLVIPSLPF